MRLLIAILSCHSNGHGSDWGSELREAQRDTWLCEAVVDHRYFLGRGEGSAEADEVWLDVPDDYDSLPIKSLALIAWAYEHDYDFIFKCDDDTYCRIDRLLSSGFEAYNYSGFRKISPWFGWAIEFAQGGAGYWLSRLAMQAVLGFAENPCTWGPEDLNLARILAAHGIRLHHDPRYQWTMDSVPRPDNDIITAHRCTPQDMTAIHEAFSVSPFCRKSST
jgi:hypothetical protein